MRYLFGVTLVLLAQPVVAHDLWGGYPAYIFDSASIEANAAPLSVGIAFTVSAPTDVQGLGYWDQGGGGFVDTHDVALYGDMWGGPDPIAMVQFSPTNPGLPGGFGRVDFGSDAIGRWRYLEIPKLTLYPGFSYVLAGFSPGPGDPWAYGWDFQSYFPYGRNVVIDSARYDDTPSGLTFPGQQFVDSRRFAAVNLMAVPEPASWAMLIAGFGLTGAVMRRRRVTAAVA